MKSTHKVYCKRVAIDRYGYDKSGQYWGTGKPLYHVQVLAVDSFPTAAPADYAEWAKGVPSKAVTEWLGKKQAWNKPYSEYHRAWSRDAAIIIARPAIGVAMFKLSQAKVQSKAHHLFYEIKEN
jgi:hypothetical protein